MSRPNILFILADDMGYGDFGVFSEGRTSTPFLDDLAETGICLTQHYTASPMCAPARASLLTGRYPHRTGAIETRELRGLCNLALREVTIGDLFRNAGYATGYVGKWHNGVLGRRFHPNARGFQEFAGFRSGWQDYYTWVLDRNGTHEKSDGRYLTDVFVDEAVGFLRRHRSEPFFLHVAFNAPHFPLQAPAEDIAPFEDKFSKEISTLYGMIRHMDGGIGSILNELDKLGITDNTLVLFSSDNGPQFNIDGVSTQRFNCDLRGCKGKVYEGGIRVPMVLRWPDGLEGKRRIASTVHFCDWLPTLAAAAAVGVPESVELDGKDMLPLLRGEALENEKKRYWQWNRYQPVVSSNSAVRDGVWKLVRPVIAETVKTSPDEQKLDSAFRNAPWKDFEPIRGAFPPREVPAPEDPQLFHIGDDPHETRDLASGEPDRVRSMLQDLEDWFGTVEADRASIGDIWEDMNED